MRRDSDEKKRKGINWTKIGTETMSGQKEGRSGRDMEGRGGGERKKAGGGVLLIGD